MVSGLIATNCKTNLRWLQKARLNPGKSNQKMRLAVDDQDGEKQERCKDNDDGDGGD